MDVSDVSHLHPLTDWQPHGGPGSSDVNGVHIPECWMIHAVVGSHVGERGYLLGERPGAPEASYDARSKIGLHSNFPRSEPTKKNDRTPEISPKSPKIR